MYKPSSRVMLYEDVINQMMTLIKKGKWQPGEKIPTENELSEYFQVSRNSIREAMKVLTHLKILNSKAGSGTFIFKDAVQSIQVLELNNTIREKSTYKSIMDTRLIIEPELVYRAALSATPNEISQLEKIINESMETINSGTYSKSTVGFSFHMEIARISKNEILFKFLESITLELMNVREATMQSHSKADLVEEINGHKQIFNYIKNNEPEKAKEAMYSHLKNALINLEKTR